MRKTFEFEIRYRDPDTDHIETLIVKFFNDTEDNAKSQAEGYAYALADKGWYRVKELKGPPDGPPNTMVGLFDTERQ